jgi:hypothetical protein
MKNIIIKLLTLLEKKPTPTTLLALSMNSFTNESWRATMFRQGRVLEYLSNK